MNELTIRVIVALFGIPILLFAILKGGIYFFSIVIIIALLSQWELYKIIQSKDMQVFTFPGYLLGVIILYFTAYGADKYLIIVSLVWIRSE